MKRFFAALMLIVIAATSANASGFRFGIKAGMNIDKIHLKNVADAFEADNRVGFTGGVMTEFQVPLLGLCFDASLMYSRMNSRLDDIIQSDANGVQKILKSSGSDFFNIPINIKYKISLPVVGNIVSPYIFTGPDFAFRLSGNSNVIKTKAFQCAWNLGIGVELIKHLQIGGSYAWGMNNVMKKAGIIGNTVNDIKARNSYWTITAAYLF